MSVSCVSVSKHYETVVTEKAYVIFIDYLVHEVDVCL